MIEELVGELVSKEQSTPSHTYVLGNCLVGFLGRTFLPPVAVLVWTVVVAVIVEGVGQ